MSEIGTTLSLPKLMEELKVWKRAVKDMTAWSLENVICGPVSAKDLAGRNDSNVYKNNLKNCKLPLAYYF